MIFAAGLGSRLRPLTDTMPKALVALDGVPMLERLLIRMKQCGITVVVVNVHHYAEKIMDFLHDNDNFGMQIQVSDESSRLLDTGGGVLAAKSMLDGDEPILLHNADIYTDIDYREMLAAHEASGADASLLMAPRTTSRYLLFDDAMRMHGWMNIISGEYRPKDICTEEYCRYAFGGVHMISPTVLDDLKKYADSIGNNVFSITEYYIDACQRMYLKGWCQPAGTRWHDIGTLEKLRQAENDIARNASGHGR